MAVAGLGENFTFNNLKINKNPENCVIKLYKDYETFCELDINELYKV